MFSDSPPGEGLPPSPTLSVGSASTAALSDGMSSPTAASLACDAEPSVGGQSGSGDGSGGDLYRFKLADGKSLQLWQFLMDLLSKSNCYAHVIHWTNQFGEFKLADPDVVSKLWGQCKGKAGMNYDKMSRAMRYYYEKGVLRKVPAKRYTYRFSENVMLQFSAPMPGSSDFVDGVGTPSYYRRSAVMIPQPPSSAAAVFQRYHHPSPGYPMATVAMAHVDDTGSAAAMLTPSGGYRGIEPPPSHQHHHHRRRQSGDTAGSGATSAAALRSHSASESDPQTPQSCDSPETVLDVVSSHCLSSGSEGSGARLASHWPQEASCDSSPTRSGSCTIDGVWSHSGISIQNSMSFAAPNDMSTAVQQSQQQPHHHIHHNQQQQHLQQKQQQRRRHAGAQESNVANSASLASQPPHLISSQAYVTQAPQQFLQSSIATLSPHHRHHHLSMSGGGGMLPVSNGNGVVPRHHRVILQQTPYMTPAGSGARLDLTAGTGFDSAAAVSPFPSPARWSAAPIDAMSSTTTTLPYGQPVSDKLGGLPEYVTAGYMPVAVRHIDLPSVNPDLSSHTQMTAAGQHASSHPVAFHHSLPIQANPLMFH